MITKFKSNISCFYFIKLYDIQKEYFMKYIIISEESNYSSMFKVLFNDLCIKKDNVFLDKYFYQRNKLYLFFMRALYKKEINKYLKNKFKFTF